jgi:hypothetical protein
MIQMPLQNNRGVTIVDDRFAWLAHYKWCLCNKQGRRYVTLSFKDILSNRKTTIYLHRVIMGCTKGDRIYIDHIDHDPLNNQTSNLRKATNGQNMCNRSGLNKNNTLGFPGLEYRSELKKPWKSTLMFERKKRNLGYFTTFEEAKEARIEAERKYYGKYAPQRNILIVEK